MATDIINPRELGLLLELYGFRHGSYLSLYLASYDLYRNHEVGIDSELIDQTLDDQEAMELGGFHTVMCLLADLGCEIHILFHERTSDLIMIVTPGSHTSVEGSAIFAREEALGAFQEALGLGKTSGSQRPVQ